MYTGMLHLHSFLRWVILILLVVAIFKSFFDRAKPFTLTHKRIGMFLVISCDLIFLIGLYQWFAGPWGLKNIRAQGMGKVMENPVERFFAIEHALAMLVAIVLVHIGRSYAKKDINDTTKHFRTLLFYGIALLIILVSVPWPFRLVGAGRHWFPGM
jgi:hypothetical protein